MAIAGSGRSFIEELGKATDFVKLLNQVFPGFDIQSVGGFLQLLFAHAGRTVPTERLLVHVWGNRADGNRQLLKQLVHRLRNKVEDDPSQPRLIRNMPNAGYSLDVSRAE